MPITDFLVRNANLYGDEICLIERNPESQGRRRVTWREYELIEPNPPAPSRRRPGVSLMTGPTSLPICYLAGDKKGDQVAILLMNCLEWLPIYFGILKTGAIAVL